MEQKNEKPLTVRDLLCLVLIALAVLYVTRVADNWRAESRYRDLRDRLERLEQRR